MSSSAFAVLFNPAIQRFLGIKMKATKRLITTKAITMAKKILLIFIKLKFLEKLTALKKESDFVIYSYVLLPNHFHFLMETGKTPLAKIMGRLLTSFALYFNKKYQRKGPLFEDRYKSLLVQKDSYFLQLSRYIHLNPVKAGLTDDPLCLF